MQNRVASVTNLGTGAGKTFIATMMIKEKMSAILHDNKKTVFLKAKLNRKRIFNFLRIADLKAPNYLWKITSLELKYENINQFTRLIRTSIDKA